MPSTRQQKKDETRSRLIQAGADVFASKGLEGARIADIAREARVAMGTLYTHFPDKEALFAEVMRAGKDIVLAGLSMAQAEQGTRTEKDRAAMAGVVAFASAYGPLFRLLLSRGAAEQPLQREVVDAIASLRVAELTTGLDEGWVRAGVNPQACARCEVGAVFHLLDWWLDDRSRLTEDELVEQLCLIRRFGVEGLIPDQEPRV